MGFGKQGCFHRHPDQRPDPALYGSWYCRQPADLPVGFLGDLHHQLRNPEPEHGSDLLDLADESRLELSAYCSQKGFGIRSKAFFCRDIRRKRLLKVESEINFPVVSNNEWALNQHETNRRN